MRTTSPASRSPRRSPTPTDAHRVALFAGSDEPEDQHDESDQHEADADAGQIDLARVAEDAEDRTRPAVVQHERGDEDQGQPDRVDERPPQQRLAARRHAAMLANQDKRPG